MKNTQFATFGGGCFWGVEKFLQDIPGVIDAVSGYAGGDLIDPSYSDVCGGMTGHAEVVNVEFDADEISYTLLLEKFISKYGKTSISNLDSVSQYRSGKNGQIDHPIPVQIDHLFRLKLTTQFRSKLTT